jgi:hypothetical protein
MTGQAQPVEDLASIHLEKDQDFGWRLEEP